MKYTIKWIVSLPLEMVGIQGQLMVPLDFYRGVRILLGNRQSGVVVHGSTAWGRELSSPLIREEQQALGQKGRWLM